MYYLYLPVVYGYASITELFSITKRVLSAYTFPFHLDSQILSVGYIILGLLKLVIKALFCAHACT